MWRNIAILGGIKTVYCNPLGFRSVKIVAQAFLPAIADKNVCSTVSSFAFSPDGLVRLWNIETGDYVKIMIGHTVRVDYLAFSPDGKMLASAGDSSSVKLWDVETGECIKTMRGHINGPVRSVAFSPDDKMLVSGGQDDCFRLWDVETGGCMMRKWVGSIWSITFSPDGQMLASSTLPIVELWDVETGERIRTIEGHTNNIYSVTFSPDGKSIASSSHD